MSALASARPAAQLRALLGHRLAKPVVFGLSLLPFFWLLYAATFN